MRVSLRIIAFTIAMFVGTALLYGQSWTTPWTAVTGVVTTAAQLNETRDNLSVLRAGGIAISGQAANRIPYATSTTQLGTSADFTFSGTVLTVGGASTRSLVLSRSGSVDVGMQLTNSLKTFAIINDSTGALKIHDDSDGSPSLFFNGNNVVFGATAGVSNTNYYTSATAQPGFLAYNSADDTGLSGGPNVADFDTEVYDNASNFSADIFTAPVTGQYHLCVTVLYTETVAGGTSVILVTSNRSYYMGATATVDAQPVSACTYADMDASDTARVHVTYAGNGTIEGGSSPLQTFFSGRLVP
jgi:hypothetical protein